MDNRPRKPKKLWHLRYQFERGLAETILRQEAEQAARQSNAKRAADQNRTTPEPKLTQTYPNRRYDDCNQPECITCYAHAADERRKQNEISSRTHATRSATRTSERNCTAPARKTHSKPHKDAQ